MWVDWPQFLSYTTDIPFLHATVTRARRRRKRSSTVNKMPLAQAHPWQPMPVQEEDNNSGEQEVNYKMAVYLGSRRSYQRGGRGYFGKQIALFSEKVVSSV